MSEVRASNFPGYAAFFFNNAMVSIGDGENHLSYILDEHKRNGTRSLGFEHPEHGEMVVRQMYDISAESFRNLDITFKDPETGDYVTERYPSSRFYVPSNIVGEAGATDIGAAVPDIISPDETTATGDRPRVTPSDQHRPTVLPGRPSDPIPLPQLPPSEPGNGRELVPNNTGGNQTGLGPLIELTPGFPAHVQEPQIHISPDQREELLEYQALLQANASDDDEVELPAGLTEADLKPAKQNRDLTVMSSKGDVWSAKAGMTAIENLEDHFASHINDFPDVTSPMEYAQAAKKFLENPPRGVQAKIRENGDILLYDPVSHTFGVRDVNGVPRTFFKPNPPKVYWDEQ